MIRIADPILTLETTAGALKAVLATIKPACGGRRQTIPILHMARFAGRTVTATNLDIEISATLPAVLAEGAACLPLVPLLALARQLPAEQDVRIVSDGKVAEIAFATSIYRIAALPADDFPDMIENPDGPALDADGDGLKKALGFVMPCISTKETRYYLNGVCFDTDMLVATDGHRLASHPVGFDVSTLTGAILPHGAVKALVRLPPVRRITAHAGRMRLRFDMDGVRMTAKMIDGKYPDWRRVVPGNTVVSRFAIGRADMLETLRRMRAVVQTGYGSVYLGWRGGALAVNAHSQPDAGEAAEMLDISGLDGMAGGVGINLRYLTEAFSTLRGRDVQVAFSDAGAPLVLTAEGGGRMVQMPMRIDDSRIAAVAAMLDGVAESEAA